MSLWYILTHGYAWHYYVCGALKQIGGYLCDACGCYL